jgi:release factor glutamine methyltransferase
LKIRELLILINNQIDSDTPALDTQILLASTFNKPRTWILSHLDTELTAPQLATVHQAIERLQSGEPLPYVLGHWEFFGMDFEISPAVLIPRPETELLVEHAISWLTSYPGRRRVLELGTGSGCIAVAIARHVPDVLIVASDISAPALRIAQQNALKHNVHKQIQFIQADLWSAAPKDPTPDQQFDMICSNPPYIPTQVLHRLPIYGREPTLALDGGIQGISVLDKVIKGAKAWLKEGGKMLVEVDSSHSGLVESNARANFQGRTIEILKDLAGHDRLLSIAG